MSGLFEHLAASDDSSLIAHRKATAVANKRVKDRFGAFLANAGGRDDHAARMWFVRDEIDGLVRDVVAEHGGDATKITAAIRHSLLSGLPGPGGLPGTTGMPGTNPAAPPAMGGGGMPTGQGTCPQCGGPLVNGQCPTCHGGSGAGGAYGTTHSIPQTPSTGPVVAKGAFCDSCRGWKSGPNQSCTCGSDSEDANSEAGTEDEEGREARVATPLSIKTQPIMHAEPLPDEPGKEGVSDIDSELARAPSAVGTGQVAASTNKEAEALKTVDLPTGDESALGGPSPKIDKSKSGDQFGWSLDPIDTQMDGSPHPSIEQDPTDKADYNKDDFLDQTRAVTETVELDSAPDLYNDAGFAPGGEEHGPHTKTFGDNGTNPVTRESLSSVDPDKNPIREILEQYDGFLMPNQVQSALQDWEVG